MNKSENTKYSNLPIIKKGKISIEEEINKKNSKLITIILIFIIIILLFLCGYTMAKTIEGVVIKSNMQIAEPIFIIENNQSIDITAEKNYGVYKFKIKNYNSEEKRTETDLKYYIEILNNIDKSINIELYEKEEFIKLNNNRTEYIQISKDKKEEKEYEVKILYDKNKPNGINDILEKIKIKVHAEQV